MATVDKTAFKALAIAALITGSCLAGHADASCECSCEAFSEWKEAATSSNGQNHEELIAMQVCFQSCMPQWQQCSRHAQASNERETRTDSSQSDGQSRRFKPPGPGRDDLKRFFGRYEYKKGKYYAAVELQAPPEHGGERYPNYMMIYAEWGDVAPWYMRSVGEDHFQARLFGDRFVDVKFETPRGGQATAMIVTHSDGPTERYPRVRNR